MAMDVYQAAISSIDLWKYFVHSFVWRFAADMRNLRMLKEDALIRSKQRRLTRSIGQAAMIVSVNVSDHLFLFWLTRSKLNCVWEVWVERRELRGVSCVVWVVWCELRGVSWEVWVVWCELRGVSWEVWVVWCELRGVSWVVWVERCELCFCWLCSAVCTVSQPCHVTAPFPHIFTADVSSTGFISASPRSANKGILHSYLILNHVS